MAGFRLGSSISTISLTVSANPAASEHDRTLPSVRRITQATAAEAASLRCWRSLGDSNPCFRRERATS